MGNWSRKNMETWGGKRMAAIGNGAWKSGLAGDGAEPLSPSTGESLSPHSGGGVTLGNGGSFSNQGLWSRVLLFLLEKINIPDPLKGQIHWALDSISLPFLSSHFLISALRSVHNKCVLLYWILALGIQRIAATKTPVDHDPPLTYCSHFVLSFTDKRVELIPPSVSFPLTALRLPQLTSVDQFSEAAFV